MGKLYELCWCGAEIDGAVSSVGNRDIDDPQVSSVFVATSLEDDSLFEEHLYSCFIEACDAAVITQLSDGQE